MVNTAHTQLSRNSVPRRLQPPQLVTTVRGVWQDNPAPTAAPPASPQPAPPKEEIRTVPKKLQTTDTHHKGNRLKKDIQLNLWVRPVVKAELERVAKREGLSISTAGEALLEHALQQDITTQHAALLEPIIDKAIGKHMRSYSNRLAVLLVRSLFTAEQTRSFVYNLLVRHPDMTDDKLNEIKTGAENRAKANITRITPQLKTLIEAVQQWLEEEVRHNG